ncbi:hypothetical protein ACTXGQ_18340 [Marinobacter sp. 1Y8]
MTDWQTSRLPPGAPRSCSIKKMEAMNGNESENSGVVFAPIPPTYSRFADDLAVVLSNAPHSLIWLHGPSGSGKTTFLKRHLDRWPLQCVWMDLRREHEVMSSRAEVLPNSASQDEVAPPVLILDNLSPRDLMILLSEPGRLASTLISGFEGAVLLVSPFDDGDVDQQLAAYTGRQLRTVRMPQSCAAERLAILREHQPGIERRWRIEMTPCALESAASGNAREEGMTPGASLWLLEAAAARKCILAKRGPEALRAITQQLHDAHRELMVAQARGHDIARVQQVIAELDIAKAAYEVDWQEQHRSGYFDQLTRYSVEEERLRCLFDEV